MIDIDWLKTLQFETHSGRVTGLVGIGSQWIVFGFQAFQENPELGKDTVIKILNSPKLGFHIREIPPELEAKPTYDAARVNRKLRAHVGNPLFDSMVEAYNDLYEYIIKVLYEGGLDAIRSMIDDEESEAFFAFLLKTPGVRRRLEDVAFLDATGDPREVVTWNGLIHTIEEPRATVAVRARSILKELQDDVVEPAGFAPAQLSDNPFWIWGGAVLDGFFTPNEMTEAVQFIAANFGNPAEGPDGSRLQHEMYAFLSLLSLGVERGKLERLTEFCNHAGFPFSMGDAPPADEQAPPKPPEERPAAMPKLSLPSVAPRFDEEGRVDPMAQDPGLLAAASGIVADFARRAAAAAHAAGIAVTLPRAENQSAPHWKPWRSVVPVQDSASARTPEDNEPAALCLTQRLLVSAQAVAARTGGAAPAGMAESLEEIGYVAIGRSHDLSEHPRLNACRSLGALAATLHRIGYVHGDLQPENFTFTEHGEIQSAFDLGRTANPGRPLTLLERASDLAVLKKHVPFLEWEAAKMGYRTEAPDADEVLAQFDQS